MKLHKKDAPTLRFPGFSNAWELTSLSSIARIYDGTHQTPSYVENGIPFVSVEDIGNIQDTAKCISPNAFEKDFKVKPRKDDILMTRITAGVIGATAIIQSDAPLGYYVSLALIRANPEVNPHFLRQSIESRSFRRELHKRIIHVAFPKKINLGDIGECLQYVPPKAEQDKIAAFLSAVDEDIGQLAKKKELLLKYKRGVMQQIFDQKIRFKDNNGNYFPDWQQKKVGEICEVVKGEQLNGSELSDRAEYPMLNGGMEPSGYTEQWNTEANTITISEGGNSCGFVNLMKVRFWCGGHCYAVKKIGESISIDFLYQVLKYREAEIQRLRVGSGLPNIQKKDLNRFLIWFPHKGEQIHIARLLSVLDEKVALLNKQLERTKMFKKGLLQQMFV